MTYGGLFRTVAVVDSFKLVIEPVYSDNITTQNYIWSPYCLLLVTVYVTIFMILIIMMSWSVSDRRAHGVRHDRRRGSQRVGEGEHRPSQDREPGGRCEGRFC